MTCYSPVSRFTGRLQVKFCLLQVLIAGFPLSRPFLAKNQAKKSKVAGLQVLQATYRSTYRPVTGRLWSVNFLLLLQVAYSCITNWHRAKHRHVPIQLREQIFDFSIVHINLSNPVSVCQQILSQDVVPAEQGHQ